MTTLNLIITIWLGAMLILALVFVLKVMSMADDIKEIKKVFKEFLKNK